MATSDTAAERLPALDQSKQNDYEKDVHARIQASQAQVPYRITNDNGDLVGMYRILATAASLGEGIMELGGRWSRGGHLTPRMQKIAILATAAKGQAAYVWYAHETSGRHLLTQDQLDALRRRERLELDDPADQAAHDVARALLDEEGNLDDALYDRAVALLGAQGLIELTWIVGIYATDTLHLRVHRLGLPEGVAQPVW